MIKAVEQEEKKSAYVDFQQDFPDTGQLIVVRSGIVFRRRRRRSRCRRRRGQLRLLVVLYDEADEVAGQGDDVVQQVLSVAQVDPERVVVTHTNFTGRRLANKAKHIAESLLNLPSNILNQLEIHFTSLLLRTGKMIQAALQGPISCDQVERKFI